MSNTANRGDVSPTLLDSTPVNNPSRTFWYLPVNWTSGKYHPQKTLLGNGKYVILHYLTQ